MKQVNGKMRMALLGLAVIAVAGATCRAGVLIDYSDGTPGGGHDIEVRDGGFEEVNNPAASTVWKSTNAEEWQLYSNYNSPNSGGQNSVVGTEDNGADLQFGQETGHILALGDQFNGSFDWRDAAGWNAGETIDMSLYYTVDDTLTGSRTVLFTWNSGNETVNNDWETATFALTTAVTDAAAVGKKLFVALEGNVLDDGSFARVDGVYLEAIPEPAALAMVAVFGGSILLIRRFFLI